MDATRSVVRALRIANGRFVEVGDAASNAVAAPTRSITGDAQVIPGMIDNHFHVQLVANRPGYETRHDRKRLHHRRSAGGDPGARQGRPGGRVHHRDRRIAGGAVAENRLPTLAELDAAAPRHPVYIHSQLQRPATTNRLAGRSSRSKGVTVAANGAIAQNGPTWDALDALRSVWTLTDRKRTMQQVFSYFNSVGLTTVHSVLGSQERGPAQYFGTADHRPMLELQKEDQLTLRLRLYFNTGPRVDGKPGNGTVRELVDNQMPDLGNDMVKTAGLGEHIVDWPHEGAVPLPEEYFQSVKLLAERGWQLMEHSFNEPNSRPAQIGSASTRTSVHHLRGHDQCRRSSATSAIRKRASRSRARWRVRRYAGAAGPRIAGHDSGFTWCRARRRTGAPINPG